MASIGEEKPFVAPDNLKATEQAAISAVDEKKSSPDGSLSPVKSTGDSDDAGDKDRRPMSDSDDPADKDKKPAGDGSADAGLGNYFRIFTFCDRLDIFLYVVAGITAIAAGASLPLMTIIFGQFTTKFNDFVSNVGDPIAAQQFRDDVDSFVLYFIYLFAGRLVVAYISNVFASIASTRTTRAIRKAFLQATLRQEVWHFDKAPDGSTSSQVTTNGNRISQGIADKLVMVVQAIALFFSAFVISLIAQWKLALITMSIVPVIVLVTGTCVAIDAVQEARVLKFYSRAAVLAQEALSSVRTVHAFWAHDKMIKSYDEFLDAAHREGNKKSPNFAVLFSTEYFSVLAGTALAYWQGYRMYTSGEIDSAGTVINVVLAVTIGATAISQILPQIQGITNASSAAAELFAVIDKPSELDPLSTEGASPPSCVGDLEIRNLDFAYPTRATAQVLKGLNLSIPAGKTTALVGASGCGKSTLVGLLERWYIPSSGEILLDGKPLSEYNTKWLRSRIRLVQQEPVLFRGTVFENIAKGFVDEQLDLPREKQMKLVVAACQSSNAHDFVEELPHGYDTQVGERASMLSGGQKQRLAIARSIISNPKVLLLDEATSALDPRAEGIVQDALNKVSVDKTTLVIAHKLATVKSADHIVVMSYGKVVEQGTHTELLALDGQYAALVRAQDLGGESEEVETSKIEADYKAEHDMSLQRTRTAASSTLGDIENQKATKYTLDYGLLKCIWIMLSEQLDLYPWFIIAIFTCLIGGGTFPAQAIIFSRLINVFTPDGGGQETANFWALMLFILALANLLAYGGVGWACNIIAQVTTHRYRHEMFKRILNFDLDFFDKPENSSGALTSKLSSIPNNLQELMAFNLFLILIVLVNVVASSTLAIAYGWKLGLVVVFGGMPVLLGCGFIRIRLEQRFENGVGDRFANSAALATEAVTSIRTVASLTLEGRILAEYGELLDDIAKKGIFTTSWTMLAYALSQSLEFLVMALGFWYGSRLISTGEYTTTQFFTIFIAVIFGGQAAGQFFGYTTAITKARPAANYILWLRTQRAEIREDESNTGKGPDGDGTIGVENVDFKYSQRQGSRVLRGIDLGIPSGSYAACVGPSGCGKSTLISLLERFYDPTSGRITLKDVNIADTSPRLYRNHMSLVQQEPTLYQGSVKENIALGLQYEPTDDEILEACRQANALDFVSSLPEGLSTPCGSKGLSFSGGQRQRLAIARALVRNPRLLLLDEATSALDTQSERVVQKTLDEAASQRTTIAVAHRLSTIRHADQIFVFADGKVAERGTHEELQKLKGRYYEMCLAQSLDNNKA